MRVATYARFSSELQDRRSISDQLAALKDYAAKQPGWQIVEEFTDAAISGASMHNRPGLQQRLAAAKARAFDVVLTESMDRLSRDLADSATLHKQLAFVGVPIITLADGEMDKVRVAVKGLVGSLYLDDLAQKTRRGQVGRVRAGRIPGGKSYGYDLVPGDDRGARAINAREADVVRRIYAEYIAGKSPLKIVHDLNAEAIPGPRGGPWNVSTLIGSAKKRNGLLNNALYIGRIVYNRQRFMKDPATGKRIARPNPESGWLTNDVPELAIVDAATWDKAQALRARRTPVQRAEQHRRPKHLLSRLMVCTACGGPMVIRTWTRGVPYFGCSARMNRRGCTNDRTVPALEVEERVVAALRKYLEAPEVIAAAVEVYRAERQRLSREAGKARRTLDRELAATEREIDLVMRAVTDGAPAAVTVPKLQALAAKKEQLEARLAKANIPDVVELHPQAAQSYAAQVAAIHEAPTAGGADGRGRCRLGGDEGG
jgi:DNA invertase Pin-like site-specific DNA recombinase/ssDNA-binding Zn-finger/Zn-ribbon topoisomerase 1